MVYDVLIVGGGPAGLSAALALGRARKRVLSCDGGPRRNAAATHIQNFVTRDGTPPDAFRRMGRADLATYPSVEIRDERVTAVEGDRNGFRVTLDRGAITARRILLATGMVDEMLPIEGFRELWGHAIFQCPYCHGWEVRDRRWGFLAGARESSHVLPFALMIRGWTDHVTLFAAPDLTLPPEVRARIEGAGIAIRTGRVRRLVAEGGHLTAVELDDGPPEPCDVLFAHPPQRQVAIVTQIGVDLDEHGFVTTDGHTLETSIPGIYAAGDLTTRMQGALLAAAAGTRAAGMINVDLALDART